MNRYFLNIQYKGTNYHGWQIQENADSVQARVNKALSTLLQEEISTLGAGRTDTGVHAWNYVAHFDTSKLLPENTDKLLYQLNALLPHDIVANSINPVSPSANARFDAVSRTYKYFISTKKSPFLTEYAALVYQPLDIKEMNIAAEKLLHYTDFKSFCKLHSDVKTTLCKVAFAQWVEEPNGLLVFTITADRFLRNMVRAIVGTLLDVGKGKLNTEQFCQIIEQQDRGKAGTSAPAQGLFLWDIAYPDTIKLSK